ncbi:protein CHLOROPLAST IMPORT APPARATUS 2-like isoform X1 [Pistacia vera]|uniref:protein CHLOROPLAST IMPORT APPARATUS 2-like isoform X1 n=1 Tax=Pistacia vera TaxID=55513 RepID=UPI00126391CC|nr:protein CHLOROPLAST IMPORT APPARATUS 2-like isoform X1 [Pistacia vera]
MTSCLSGGGRTYALDLDIIKSPSSSTRTSHTSSPSSTLSESSNSPLAISTRKPRTARKRPKQTYNEAAALLSTAYPNIFSRKHLTNPSKFTNLHESFLNESSELLLPFRVFDHSGFMLHQPIQDKPRFPFERKVSSSCDKPCQSNGNGEVDFQGNSNSNSMELSSEFHEDFDAESILDEEIEEGIDSIMGNLRVNNDDSNVNVASHNYQINNSWYANPMGLGFGGKLQFGIGMGMRRGVNALRHVDEGNWWSFPTVDVVQISPKFNNHHQNSNSNKKVSNEKKKKKRAEKESEKVTVEYKSLELKSNSPQENSIPKSNSAELLLKLKYDDVVTAWADRGSPFLDETLGSDVQGNDVSARLAQIDLFSDSGVREASVLRYKEKRRTRLFSKKIRYQVRKVNADRRPRMKGRFVRRPNSTANAQDEKGKKKVLLSDL